MFAAPRSPRKLEACLRDLASESASVRAESARDLGRHGGALVRGEVVDALIGALGDGSSDVRAAAATSLADVHAEAPLAGATGDRALDALTAACADASPLVRQMAVAAIGEIGGEAAPALLEAGLADAAPEVRFQAVIAYPRRAPDEAAAVNALEAATRDDDELVAHIALRMAEEIGEKAGGVDPRLVRRARALLAHDAPMVRLAAAILLARAGEEGGEAILAEAARGDLVTPEGADVATAIELSGELAIAAARPGLEKRAWGGAFGLFTDRFRWHARVALARMGDERAPPAARS
jgi:HEAT repeat protein